MRTITIINYDEEQLPLIVKQAKSAQAVEVTVNVEKGYTDICFYVPEDEEIELIQVYNFIWLLGSEKIRLEFNS